MTRRGTWKLGPALIAMALVGCGDIDPADQEQDRADFGDISGVEEIAQPLSPLATTPTFATGTLLITLAPAGELCIVSKHAVTGNILVNDVAITGATSTAVKTITINGDAGVDTVIIDFANGTFALGSATATHGIFANLLGGANIFKIRGVSTGTTGDNITVGGTNVAVAIALNTDLNEDINVTSGAALGELVVSMGASNDTFNAGSGLYGTLVAYNAAITVFGGDGNDTLTGGTGADSLNGDAGNDTLDGGTGNDILIGGADTDTVTYATRSTFVTVTVADNATGDGEAGETDDVQATVEIVRGSNHNDVFTGAAGDQTFFGGLGNDTFNMGVNGTTGAGLDTIYGEGGSDTVNYGSYTLGPVNVSLAGNLTDDGLASEDVIRDDVENVICPTAAVACDVDGNTADNSITGGGGVDTVDGGAGDDTFVNLAGAAGAGADSFVGGLGLDKVDFSAYAAVVTINIDGTAGTDGKTFGTDVENVTCPTASDCTVNGNIGNNIIVGSSGADTINAGAGDDRVESGATAVETIACGDGSDIYIDSDTTRPADCEL